ncbi:hypothetical protein FQA39_LY06092 [Lamprigera yunnana]|nr:hypothetical protein FQA39_LY06092 [Lamprigera yunnana]
MKNATESTNNLLSNEMYSEFGPQKVNRASDKSLGPVEKLFLLHVERGDINTVKRLINEYSNKPNEFDVNAVDPLNRSALVTAIENGNIDLIKLLLDHVSAKDSLLHAIKEEFVEAVELLLEWEEEHHKSGELYSWESIDNDASAFTSDITPLILAAHKNNYEIIKILLDRGATLPVPHDVKCGCDDCVKLRKEDSLRHSQARINAYRALISPSLIALSSKDPLLTAFQLSEELRKLSRIEAEFCAEYNVNRQIQHFSTSILDYARSSYELEVILNYDPKGDNWDPGEHQTLERLRLALKCKQKMFVAHPNVQQLLAAIWYEGVPGFRRKKTIWQIVHLVKLIMLFPFLSVLYIIAPRSKPAQFIQKPFIKFVCHSASYVFFLTFLSMASQRVENIVLEFFDVDWIKEMMLEWKRKERGALPGVTECVVIVYVISLMYVEVRSLWENGLEYLSDLWNIFDFITNAFYVLWMSLRFSSCYIVRKELREGRDPWYPREQWQSFDPMLLSEGAFAAGMIFSFLKLVHIFSVSPHLGPLQISLGRMFIDIVKFFFIYTLVLFAFACGLNQLLWYYAVLEKNDCHTKNGLPDFDDHEKACTIWRRYSNLFESTQSLFWASFGLVDLVTFDLNGIKAFTRFWALLMFGSYSVINVIVLLNMLIAMMSNSYQIISERADTEWKFARSRLWLKFFNKGDTLPPPFNIFPTPKFIMSLMRCKKGCRENMSFKSKSQNRATERHEEVIALLIKRYITAEQQRRDIYGITEDDVLEIRQDISSLRYELINILQINGMKTPKVTEEDYQVCGKKDKVMERRILKDFYIGALEGMLHSCAKNKDITYKNLFNQIFKVITRQSQKERRKQWNKAARRSTSKSNPIGSTREANISKRKSQKRSNELQLSELSEGTRKAYEKFMASAEVIWEEIQGGDSFVARAQWCEERDIGSSELDFPVRQVDPGTISVKEIYSQHPVVCQCGNLPANTTTQKNIKMNQATNSINKGSKSESKTLQAKKSATIKTDVQRTSSVKDAFTTSNYDLVDKKEVAGNTILLNTEDELFPVIELPLWKEPPNWPAECQVLNERISHMYYFPSEREPYYQITENEPKAVNAKGKSSGVTIFDYDSDKVNVDVGGSSVSILNETEESLQFESRFESGNLAKAVKTGIRSYDLYLRSDLNTEEQRKWFYFRVMNTKKDVPYRLSIVNITKNEYLYTVGMKPLLYSTQNAASKKIGWIRCGSNITFTPNRTSLDSTEPKTYTLSFNVNFPYDNDMVYFAYCYPYTYSDLKKYLFKLANDPVKSKYVTIRLLGETLAKNSLYLVNITSRSSFSSEKKEAIILSARTHPSETPGSWMMKGALDFLTGNSSLAKSLRTKFVFKIVPMLNPDGVIVGNSRYSLAGKDLNRQFKTASQRQFPGVWFSKLMMQKTVGDDGVRFFCDFHAHSVKHNIFIFACADKVRAFPQMIYRNAADKFSYGSCTFNTTKSKEGTARIVMWNMGVENSFTMEASVGGTSNEDGSGAHFTIHDYEEMGKALCETLLDYFDLPTEKKIYKYTFVFITALVAIGLFAYFRY